MTNPNSATEAALRLASLYEALEFPLEQLVRYCNNDDMHCNASEVISAEAALEALYKARVAAQQHCQCPACIGGITHFSDCSVHGIDTAGGIVKGPCDCDVTQQTVIAAALNIFGETATAAFFLPIPNTTPPLFVAAGEREQIAALAAPQQSEPVAHLAYALDLLDYLRGYPDFSDDEHPSPVREAIEEVIAGKRASMLSACDYLAQGLRPPQPTPVPAVEAEGERDV